MRKRWGKPQFRILLAGALGILCLTPPVQHLASAPDEVEVPLGEHAIVPMGVGGYTTVTTSNDSVVQVEASADSQRNWKCVVLPQDLGDATVSSRVFGFMPWKSVHVHVVPQNLVYVGGQSIGVRLESHGAMIVGFQRLGPNQACPAADAHLKLGDVIVRINQRNVTTASDIRRLANLDSASDSLTLTVRRKNQQFAVPVQPVTDPQGVKHLGIFVRDKTSGVGTLTFYDPQHHRFGALGHMITDADTGLPIDGTGRVYEAEITGVLKGEAGKPGEKRGRFNSASEEIGQIDKNTPFGVFGEMDQLPTHLTSVREYPIALPSQVHQGPAEILTVLHGQKVEGFSVNIENVTRQAFPNTKSMILHVTDGRLLDETGGIVQGMSGSPIIQDGRLVGAVTHVFVSDPTRGYGVYAKWMLSEADSTETTDPVIRSEIHAAMAKK